MRTLVALPPSFVGRDLHMTSFRIFSENDPQEASAKHAGQLLAKAEHMQPGADRDRVLKNAREADIRANLFGWINSPGLQSPKRLDQ